VAAPDLLVTKFTIPPVRANQLPRAPLIERLNQSTALPLVLLSAGAGFGKTTLLAAWAEQCSRLVAWLALDPLDNDPLRFWGAVLSALRTRLPAIGEAVLTQMQAPQPPQMIPLVTTLINDLAAAGEEAVLILDDYHLIDEPGIHSSLQFLLEHAPSCLHLVLASRVDPPFALARLRARGQLAELRDMDLRANEQETASFLQRVMEIHLSAEDERRLAQRTDGWLVGLQLAALSLSRQADPSAWVAAFSGSQRLILDYLQEEVLARQKPAIRRFLLRVCILPRMNASLCQAVTGIESSQEMLETLERMNLFVVPLDEQRQWYRLHDLFREALLARLHIAQPDLMPSLYERAARWYEQHGLLPDAVEAALNAEDFVRGAALIERCIDPASLRNAYHTLCRWLERLPKDILQAQPALSFWYALATMFTSLRRAPASWARIELLLQWAEQGFESQGESERLGEALELHAELAFFQDDLSNMEALAQRATPLLPPQSLMYATNLLIRGLEHLLTGNVETAWQHFLDGRKHAERIGSLTGTVAAILLLAEASLVRGELHQAERYCRQALAQTEDDPERLQQQLMTGAGDRDPFFLTWATHILARLAYEWNDLETAQRLLLQGQALGGNPAIHMLTSGGVIQARLVHRSGKQEEAQHLLETWERHARFPWAMRALRAWQARLQLEQGNLPVVERWSRARQDPADIPERDQKSPFLYQEAEALLLARLSLAQGEPAAALQELGRWQAQAERQGRAYTLLEMLLLEAQAHQATRAVPQARAVLHQAVRLAYPERYQRVFLDEGQSLAAILKSSLKDMQESGLAAYVRGLLDAFEQEQAGVTTGSPQRPPAMLEPLTPQEQRILHLVAEGASNQQIANQLVISLVTVKKHVSNILSKLGVANRTQALVRAKEYDLL
jgi:LuxR family transcriptional regulator, maltose regulon positive regulatory protein